MIEKKENNRINDIWLTIPNFKHSQLLCDVIHNLQIEGKLNSFKFDWKLISSSLRLKGVSLSATDCHVLWKYLAYGLVLNDNKVANGSDDEVDIESDEGEGFLDPQVASIAFQVDSLSPSQCTHEDRSLFDVAPSVSYLSTESLCAKAVAGSRKTATITTTTVASVTAKNQTINKKLEQKPKASIKKRQNEIVTAVYPVTQDVKKSRPPKSRCKFCRKFFPKDVLHSHQVNNHSVEMTMDIMLNIVTDRCKKKAPNFESSRISAQQPSHGKSVIRNIPAGIPKVPAHPTGHFSQSKTSTILNRPSGKSTPYLPLPMNCNLKASLVSQAKDVSKNSGVNEKAKEPAFNDRVNGPQSTKKLSTGTNKRKTPAQSTTAENKKIRSNNSNSKPVLSVSGNKAVVAPSPIVVGDNPSQKCPLCGYMSLSSLEVHMTIMHPTGTGVKNTISTNPQTARYVSTDKNDCPAGKKSMPPTSSVDGTQPTPHGVPTHPPRPNSSSKNKHRSSKLLNDLLTRCSICHRKLLKTFLPHHMKHVHPDSKENQRVGPE